MTPNAQLKAELETKVLTLANVPYSFDFTGADKVLITFRESSPDDGKTDNILITEVKKVEEIISILKTMPKIGERSIDMTPTKETNIIAFKGEQAFAHVKFYGTLLQGEDTSFSLDSEAEQNLLKAVTQA